MRLRYSLVTRTLWSDVRFRELSAPEPNAQTLWIYLLTGPVQGPIPGLFSAGVGALADGLGWPVDVLQQLVEELEEASLIKRSKRPPLIWLPRAINHNPPTSPNVVKSWRGPYLELPETDLREEAMAGIRAGLRGESFLRAFDVTFPGLRKPSRKPSRKASRKGTPEASGKASEGGSDVPSGRASPGGQQAPRPTGKPSRKASGKPSPIQEQDTRGTKRDSGTSPPRYGPEARRLAEALRESIRTHTPRIAKKYDGKGKLLTWERDLERLMRLDGATEGEVRAVILWAHRGDESGFWRPNLLSGGKVREHFDRLIIQARQGGAKIASGTHNPTKEWMDEHHRWLLRWADEAASLDKVREGGLLLAACARDGIPTPPDTQPLLRWLEDRQ